MSNSDFNLLNSGAEEDASHAEMTEVISYVFFFRHASVSSTYPCLSVSKLITLSDFQSLVSKSEKWKAKSEKRKVKSE